MISHDLYNTIVLTYFKNKNTVKNFQKIYHENVHNYEICCFYLDNKKTGLLFLAYEKNYYVTKISKTPMTADKSGRIKPVICDLCYTRMPGSKICKVSTERISDHHSFTWMICSNFDCSLHSRELTNASKESKKILGENISIDRRIMRLKEHVKLIIDTLQLESINEIPDGQ